MAAALLDPKSQEALCEKLTETKMLTIMIPDKRDPDVEEYHRFVSVPKALACAVASNLCIRLPGDKYFLNILDLFKNAEIDPKEELHTFDMVKSFSIWLYTEQVIARQQQHLGSEIKYYDLWFFGEILGCPLFQDSIIKSLADLEISKTDKTWRSRTFSACWDGNDLMWTQPGNVADPRSWSSRPCPRSWSSQLVDFQKKKIILFAMDSLAWGGINDKEVQELIMGGGRLGWELAKRLVALETARESHHGLPPWDAANIGRYLVSENTEDPTSAVLRTLKRKRARSLSLED
ncbi:hypothetical protein ACEPPN_015661 [Leptodophora sp. 'Broadleaf-Isolate-01']